MASGKNYMLNDNFPKHIKNATSTSDGLMSSEDKSRVDALFEFGLLAPATPDKDGIMTKEDKTKLDGIAENANNYIHPDDENTRHVTDEQIEYWNNKAAAILATQSSDGLMSAEDKKKLDTIAENANNYIHPNDEFTRHVTDEEKDYWDNKADKTLAGQEQNGLMSAEDKKKLDTIEENLTKYEHPENHPASMIIQDETHRFVTDAQILQWDSGIEVADIPIATKDISGLMSSTDKEALDDLILKVQQLDEKLKTAVFYE